MHGQNYLKFWKEFFKAWGVTKCMVFKHLSLKTLSIHYKRQLFNDIREEFVVYFEITYEKLKCIVWVKRRISQR